MIRSYASALTEAVASGKAPKGFPADLLRRAIVKLTLIDNAFALNDLASPPGNRLEALKGDRRGQHSIRINDQWRICFVWVNGGAENVEIVDYH
ncbi:type II toxin-antitoxin system RelE/ParE family toxin [Rhizobium cremeum]|uniref:type II toxin-antitoxin system RelE/ParE family toxin n=1 Tax=Rhizobium cremeum TaxID=2813827 RepID=UPI000DD81D7D|nr:type II toxin-antitoxin system RelE/ParE family toxin [Rhizobium cremeum]MCJ7997972.1 type II toxin-antitoxin system RelE/ParE family toxin [Rhizobium cremeum]MCJ8003066.1 type II toxin-antitoxin system RelE/ParE family toxin [Rhizobium cremeum]